MCKLLFRKNLTTIFILINANLQTTPSSNKCPVSLMLFSTNFASDRCCGIYLEVQQPVNFICPFAIAHHCPRQWPRLLKLQGPITQENIDNFLLLVY